MIRKIHYANASDFEEINSNELILKEGASFHEIDTNDGIRTISEICIDADNHSDDLGYLSNLWQEVLTHKKEYPLVQLKFMIEYLEDFARQMARRDAALVKDFFSGSGIFD